MDISMKEFMIRVKNNNFHFNLPESSLNTLINKLGGAYDESQGLDMRNITHRQTLIEIQEARWGINAAEDGAIPLKKRRKYKTALDYLVGKMWQTPGSKRIVLKKRENKINWKVVYLGYKPKWFVHCSGVTPQQILASGGLDPTKSTEVCIPKDGLIGEWIWHEFVFAFEIGENDKITPPQAAKNLGFAAGGYIYRFQQGQHTQLMCQNGKIVDGNEIGFPELIPMANIEVYSWNGNKATLKKMNGFKQ